MRIAVTGAMGNIGTSAGLRRRASGGSPVLRVRTVAGSLRDAVTRGPMGVRDRP